MRVAIFSLDLLSYACAQIRLIRPFFYLYPEIKYKWCVQSDGNNYAISYDALELADLIIIQRYFPLQETWPCIEKILNSGKPVICEIDDLLWQVPVTNPLAYNMERTKPYIMKILPLVHAVTTVKFIPFEQAYVRFVKRMFSLNLDIALAPLEDNEFNRCKSNIKWLEYSSCAVPGIYSDLPPYAKDIQSGKDGFLVGSSKKEWVQALEFLICNKKERIKIGYMAQQRVMEEFTLNEDRVEAIKKTYLMAR